MHRSSAGASSRSRRAEIVRTVRTALGYAAVFSILAALQSTQVSGRAFLDRFGLRLWEVIAVYFGGAVTAGLVVGVLKPLARSLPGAMVVGVIAVYPAILALSPVGLPDAAWRERATASLVLASMLGPAYAWALWERPTR